MKINISLVVCAILVVSGTIQAFIYATKLPDRATYDCVGGVFCVVLGHLLWSILKEFNSDDDGGGDRPRFTLPKMPFYSNNN